jgi:hypothetical protein
MIRKLASCLALALVLAVGVLSVSSRQAQAAAGGLISPAILGGLNQTVSTGGSTGYTAGARLGFGLAILEADVSAMYLNRSFSVLGLSGNISYLQIPVMLRYSLIPMFSIGAGGYYDFALTSGASKIYGIRGAAMFSPVGLPLFGEVNYSYNLGPDGSGNVNDFQVLAGFKF